MFYKLLNNLADYLAKGQVRETSLKANLVKSRSKVNPLALCARQTKEMKLLLAALYKQSVPPAAGSLTLQMVSLNPHLPDPMYSSHTHTHT